MNTFILFSQYIIIFIYGFYFQEFLFLSYSRRHLGWELKENLVIITELFDS